MKNIILIFAFTIFTTFISFSQETEFIKDIDGNVYKTVKIGNQWWMAENLRVTSYRNGDTIPNITDYKQWSKDTLGAYCNPNNYVKNAAKYGRLYNYFAVKDPRGLVPEGWHVASIHDWRNLRYHLGFNKLQGLYMQEIDNNYWSKKMQYKNEISWLNLKSEILETGFAQFYLNIDTFCIYQYEDKQENDYVFWSEIKRYIAQLTRKEIEIEYLQKWLPEFCRRNIDTITFIYQKKKKREIYKMNWEGTHYKHHLVGYGGSIKDAVHITSFLKLDTIILNNKKKVEQKIYVINWKNDKQKNDTIYWNKAVSILDIIAWVYVKYASNNSGFNALPVGYRSSIGDFSYLGRVAYWLTVKPNKPDYVWFHNLSKNGFSIGHDRFVFKKEAFGYSIRCVKD